MDTQELYDRSLYAQENFAAIGGGLVGGGFGGIVGAIGGGVYGIVQGVHVAEFINRTCEITNSLARAGVFAGAETLEGLAFASVGAVAGTVVGCFLGVKATEASTSRNNTG